MSRAICEAHHQDHPNCEQGRKAEKLTFEQACQIVKLELVSCVNADLQCKNKFWGGAVHGVGTVLNLLEAHRRTGLSARGKQAAKNWKSDEMPRCEWDDSDLDLLNG